MFRERDPLFSDEVFRTLLEGARRGEAAALVELWQALAPRLLRHADRNLPDRHRSAVNPSDLVQQTYLRFQSKLGTHFEGDTCGQLEAWLQTILKNLLIDSLKKIQPGPIPSDEISDSGSTPSSGLRRAELREQVRRCLDQLSEDDRQALDLRVIRNLSHQESAQILDLQPDTFARRFTRAVDRFRRKWKELGHDPRDLESLG